MRLSEYLRGSTEEAVGGSRMRAGHRGSMQRSVCLGCEKEAAGASQHHTAPAHAVGVREEVRPGGHVVRIPEMFAEPFFR